MNEDDYKRLTTPFATSFTESLAFRGQLEQRVDPITASLDPNEEINEKIYEKHFKNPSTLQNSVETTTSENTTKDNILTNNIISKEENKLLEKETIVIQPTDVKVSNTNVETQQIVSENTSSDNNTTDSTGNGENPNQDDTNVNKSDTNEEENSKENNEKEKKVALHVEYGNRIIDTLHLCYYNDTIYFYQGGVYETVDDRDIISVIIQKINPSAEPAICKKVVFYIRNKLYNNETMPINSNFVNFNNCLFNLETQIPIEHTSSVFTVNQLAVDFNPNLPYNSEVEGYLDDLTNHNPLRKKGLLQAIGYLETSKNNIQKMIIIYGPSASNGKSAFLKVINRMVGPDNVCHKSIEEFDKNFGADGMEFKLLNISTELPQTRIKDVSVLKKTVTGDAFEATVKFEKNKTIHSYIKHLYATNYLPNVSDDSEGYYRRLHIILLDNKFDASTSKFDVDKFCSQENLNYLANLAFKEYLEMVNSGSLEFANSEESEKILENYRLENDTVLSFLLDADIAKAIYGNDFERKAMYKLYKTYCSHNEFKPLTKNAFYRELRDKYQFQENPKKGNTEIDFYREQPVTRTYKS